MTTIPLLPCPFCGNAPWLHENDWCEPTEWSVQCGCLVTTAGSLDKSVAAAFWNTRTPIPSTVQKETEQ